MCILTADDSRTAAVQATTTAMVHGVPIEDAIALTAAQWIPWCDPTEEDLDEAIAEVQAAVNDLALVV